MWGIITQLCQPHTHIHQPPLLLKLWLTYNQELKFLKAWRKKQLKTFSEVCAYLFPAEPIKADKKSPVIEESLT